MATIGLNAIYAGIKLPNGHIALADQGVDETGIFEIDTKDETHDAVIADMTKAAKAVMDKRVGL